MPDLNHVVVCGRLTRDVELRKVPSSGVSVTELSVAINDRRKDHHGQWITDSTFVEVTVWGSAAENAAETLGVGSTVLVNGRLKMNQWEAEGEIRSRLRVVADRLQHWREEVSSEGD